MKRADATRTLYDRIRQILESAKASVSRSVNSTQVVACWLIGREIVEEQQKGLRRAGYGEALLQELSNRLTHDFDRGWSVRQLEYVRSFYLEYGSLLHSVKSNAVRSISLDTGNANAARAKLATEIVDAPRKESWKPGQLHPNLSWTHYRMLLRVDRPEARAFYEIEAIKNNWGTRELERQICSLLYERLALSRDKKGLMRLATTGHVVQKPTDVFKDPVVMEFLGLPESPKLAETDLETALIGNLQFEEVRLLQAPPTAAKERKERKKA
jgi:hypothetical protein